MLESIFSSFLLVALSEMGDKTQLLAFSLALRYKKPWPIMGGILAATLLNHGLASYSGAWLSRAVRPDVMGYVLGASFIAFGFWTLKPDSPDEKEHPPRFGVFVTTAILFFFAEMGDKTQLATVALGAQYQSALGVTAGTTMGMLAADGLAVFMGEKFSEKVQMAYVRWAAAGLFFLCGLGAIFKVLLDQ